MITSDEFSERRQRLFDSMADGSILLVFSGVAKSSSADETYPFEVNRNFYYLTGIDQEDSSLLLVNAEGERREFLFISPFDPVKEKWYGRRLTPQEASSKSGVHNVLLNTALPAKIDAALSEKFQEFGEVSKVYLDLEKEQKIAEATTTHEYRDSLAKVYSNITIEDCYPAIIALRRIKSPNEIKELREAIRHTQLGIAATMALVRPGVKEYELADEFFKVINDDSGYQGVSFPTIMASGVHGACLHYMTPLDNVKKGDLVLMDLGSRHNYYCADITRTVPANGHYDDFQKMIYSIVLGCNKMIAALAKPGLTIKDLQNATVEYLASECLEKGLIAKKEDIVNYYFHGISHHIGLDTHDPSDRELPLSEGCVISDEPGLYIKEKNIGVRIEDDLLITKDGCEVLSKDIIKEIPDIELFYKSR
jgi:Xaa-Pro aminopeptidase